MKWYWPAPRHIPHGHNQDPTAVAGSEGRRDLSRHQVPGHDTRPPPDLQGGRGAGPLQGVSDVIGNVQISCYLVYKQCGWKGCTVTHPRAVYLVLV